MKTLCVFLIVAVTAQLACTQEQGAFSKACKKCSESSGVNEAQFKAFVMNGQKPEEATQPIKCHIKCIMEELQHFKNGVFDADAAIKTWSAMPRFQNDLDNIKKALDTCKSEKGKDDCDTAYMITACMMKNNVGANMGMDMPKA